jgi:hypothetical protein
VTGSGLQAAADSAVWRTFYVLKSVFGFLPFVDPASPSKPRRAGLVAGHRLAPVHQIALRPRRHERRLSLARRSHAPAFNLPRRQSRAVGGKTLPPVAEISRNIPDAPRPMSSVLGSRKHCHFFELENVW